LLLGLIKLDNDRLYDKTKDIDKFAQYYNFINFFDDKFSYNYFKDYYIKNIGNEISQKQVIIYELRRQTKLTPEEKKTIKKFEYQLTTLEPFYVELIKLTQFQFEEITSTITEVKRLGILYLTDRLLKEI
jgi:hypothetical protein